MGHHLQSRHPIFADLARTAINMGIRLHPFGSKFTSKYACPLCERGKLLESHANHGIGHCNGVLCMCWCSYPYLFFSFTSCRGVVLQLTHVTVYKKPLEAGPCVCLLSLVCPYT